jgi:hypothetical protein
MEYTVEMASDGIICTKFHHDWYRRSSNIKILLQQFERL